MKTVLKKIGKAVWSALPWFFMTISLTCWLMLPLLYITENAELESHLAALESENTRYASESAHFQEEVEWLRSLIELDDVEGGDGQIQ